MSVARLVLEYLQVLVWPFILVLVVVLNRKQIGELLRRLPDEGSAEIPVLGKYSWKRRIEEVVADSAQLPASPTAAEGPPRVVMGESTSARDSTEDSFERLAAFASVKAGSGHRNWNELRQLAVATPAAGVLDCWETTMFLVYAFAYTEKAPMSDSWQEDIGASATYLGAPARVAAILADLKDLRDQAAGGADVTRSGALSYVDTAQHAVESWFGSEWATQHFSRYGQS